MDRQGRLEEEEIQIKGEDIIDNLHININEISMGSVSKIVIV